MQHLQLFVSPNGNLYKYNKQLNANVLVNRAAFTKIHPAAVDAQSEDSVIIKEFLTKMGAKDVVTHYKINLMS